MNTLFIQSLHVRNVKAFQSLTIDKFKRINLIGGKNGSGKTTLLEIIHFLRSSDGVSFVRKYTIPFTKPMLPLVFNKQHDEIGATLFISAESNAGTLEKTITVEKYISKGVSQGDRPSPIIRQNDKRANTIRFTYSADGTPILRGTLDMLDGKPQNYIEELGNDTAPLPNCGWATAHADETAIDELLTKITLENNKHELITNLQIMDESITDIMAGRADGKSLISVQSQKGWLPLSACGGGVIALTNVLLMIMNCRDGFVIADLVDAELHHSVVQEYWRAIALLAQKYNCQLFFTTHSVENLRKAYQGIEDAAMLDDMQYIRLGKREEESIATVYTAEEMYDSLKFDIDVR